MEAVFALFCCCSPFFLILLILFSYKIGEFHRWVADRFARMQYSIQYCIEEQLVWIWGEHEPPVKDYMAWRRGSSTRESVIHDSIRNLAKDIIRLRYICQIVGLKPISDFQFSQKLKELRRLEKLYPRFKCTISPTDFDGHDEHVAVQEFGYQEWQELKRTYSLLS